MVTIIFTIFVLTSALIAISDWRKGVVLMCLAAALQDPVRKLMPGIPSYMVLAFMPIWFAVCFSLFTSNKDVWGEFSDAYPAIASKIKYFLISIVIAMLVLLANYGFGFWKVGVIGGISYLFPIVAILAGYYFIQNVSDFWNLVKTYTIFTGFFLIGGLLQYLHLFPDWTVLGTDVMGMEWIRHIPGYKIQLNAGFYRSPDIMAWHAATFVMFSLMILQKSNLGGFKYVWIFASAWGLINLFIAGRNKMLFMPAVFVVVLAFSFFYQGKFRQLFAMLFVALLILSSFYYLNSKIDISEEYIAYPLQGAGNSTDRISKHGIDSVIVTYKQSGFFGKGLGSAATGMRHAGSGSSGAWQEGGLSRIMVELGVIGFIAAALLGVSLVHTYHLIYINFPQPSEEHIIFLGLVGLLLANGTSFVVSHQVFGDPFIVVFSSFLLGVALSAPRWWNQTNDSILVNQSYVP